MIEAIKNKFIVEDRQYLVEQNEDIRKANYDLVVHGRNIDNENQKSIFEDLHSVYTFKNNLIQAMLKKSKGKDKNWYMKYERTNPNIETHPRETAYTIGYAKIMRDGWMPHQTKRNTYINHKFKDLGLLSVTLSNKTKRDVRNNYIDYSYRNRHQAKNCYNTPEKMFCKYCIRDHSDLLKQLMKFLNIQNRKRPASSLLNDSNKRRRISSGSGSSSRNNNNNNRAPMMMPSTNSN